MPQEEPEHFARCVRPGWIGVTSGWVSAGPGMTSSLDHPVLAAGLAASGAMRGHGVGATTGREALALDLSQPRVGGQGPGNHEPAIPGMHHRVGVPVKHDRPQGDGWPVAGAPCFMAINPDAALCAAPAGSAECTPAAANRSG